MSNLDQLRVFVEVVEAGAASRAAGRLGVANSAVSRRLKELETRLGVTLIQRTTRQMTVTEVGQAFYRRARAILDDLDDAEDEARAAVRGLHGTLRVAASVSFGVAHLAPVVAEFMHLHPDLRVELDIDDRRIDLVQAGVDLAIRIGELEDSSLIARKLSHMRHVACAAPAFLATYGSIDRPEDLTEAPTLAYTNSPHPNRWSYRARDGSEGEVRVTPRLSASSGDALREAAIAGLGVVCEPSFIVHDAIARGALQPILTDWTWYGRNIYAVYPAGAYLPRRARAFIDFLAEKFGDHPYWEAIFDHPA